MNTNNRKGILWFRSDLRLHDNEALHDALRHGGSTFPVYVFDSRVFKGKTRFGFRKTELFRSQFILESVGQLRERLRSKGSDIIIRVGKPEEIIANLAKELRTHWVFCNRERTQEELTVQDRLEQSLWAIGQEIRYSRGKMLYYTSDLPFPVTHTPDTYTQFRKEVEKITPIRNPLPTPETLPSLELGEEFDFGKIPSLQDFGFSEPEIEKLGEDRMRGGEHEGLTRLQYYLWESDLAADYKNTRNGLLGTDYSSRLSIHLSHGCLSPKMVCHELRKYENERVENDSTHHLFLELLWRDFFRLMAKKHGNTIFQQGGIKQIKRPELKEDEAVFRIWAEGRTGVPFVDAAMIELNATGFMSSRARQNVASFLVHDLHINWQVGASYFESLLVDYDPCSNWVNWNYISGVGTDSKDAKHFNIVKQAKRYDPHGAFVRHWIPALEKLTDTQVHEPYRLSPEAQEKQQFILGRDYPKACLQMEH